MNVGVRELKARLSEYLRCAERGEVITVTQRGRAKAILGPLPEHGPLGPGVKEGVTPPVQPGLRRVGRHPSRRRVLDILGEDKMVIAETMYGGDRMKSHKITTGGQISLPAALRRRWGTKTVGLEDLGDRLIVRPLPDDPIAAARGALKGRIRSTAALRARARKDDAGADARR